MRNEILDFENVHEGRAVIRNRETGLGIEFLWDNTILKNCKLWLCTGNDEGHHHHGGAYVVCILPCSSQIMNLDKAVEKGDALRLDAFNTAESYFEIKCIRDYPR